MVRVHEGPPEQQYQGSALEAPRGKPPVRGVLTPSTVSEALRLRIEDVRFGERTVSVRARQGQKDGTGFFGSETAQVLQNWLGVRRDAMP